MYFKILTKAAHETATQSEHLSFPPVEELLPQLQYVRLDGQS